MDPSLDSELRDDFLVEAGELIERLGEQLVALEAAPRDAELLNAVFRAFHTVKGGAGFLAIEPMVQLCHHCEDLLNEARSGALVRFDVRRTRQALLVLRQADGQPVPVGSRVQVTPGGAEFEAGRRGEVWLTDLSGDKQHLKVSWTGHGCELEVTVPPSDNGAPVTLGPLVCEGRTP